VVIENDVGQFGTHDFLLTVRPISSRFQDKTAISVENRQFSHPRVYI